MTFVALSTKLLPPWLTQSLKSIVSMSTNSWRTLGSRIFPYKWLSPVQKFRRDGWNSLIYDSHKLPTAKGLEQIVVFGGYLGASTDLWLTRFADARISVFEPVPGFASILDERFDGRNVTVHRFGVSSSRSKRLFAVDGDATRALANSSPESLPSGHQDKMVSVDFLPVEEVKKKFPERIGILEVNIEGGEYELLPLLHSVGILHRAEHLFVQFHKIEKNSKIEMEAVRKLLESSHRCEWNYEFVWEHWIRHPVSSRP